MKSMATAACNAASLSDCAKFATLPAVSRKFAVIEAVRLTKSCFYDQGHHAAEDSNGKELVSWEVVDEERGHGYSD